MAERWTKLSPQESIDRLKAGDERDIYCDVFDLPRLLNITPHDLLEYLKSGALQSVAEPDGNGSYREHRVQVRHLIEFMAEHHLPRPRPPPKSTPLVRPSGMITLYEAMAYIAWGHKKAMRRFSGEDGEMLWIMAKAGRLPKGLGRPSTPLVEAEKKVKGAVESGKIKWKLHPTH